MKKLFSIFIKSMDIYIQQMSDIGIYKAHLGKPNGDVLINFSEIDCKNAVIIRTTNWLGDAVMTLSAVYKIQKLIPKNIQFIVLTSKKLESFWKAFNWVDQVISFDSKRISGDAITAIKKANAGVAIILPNSFGSAFDMYMKDIPIRLGRAGRGRGLMLTHKLPEWKRIAGQDRHHQLYEYLQIARACGSEEWDTSFKEASVSEESDFFTNQGINFSETDYLALAPGAAYGPAKQWPVEYFIETAQWWEQRGGKVVVVGTDSEHDIAEQVVSSLQSAINLAGKTNIPQLMHLLGKVKFSVVNDSGAMHLAASMNGKGIAIYGSTDPEATGPVGGRWRVLWNKLDCSPCLDRTCNVDGRNFDCLRGIKPSNVIKTLERF